MEYTTNVADAYRGVSGRSRPKEAKNRACARSSRELFYRNGEQMLAVDITTQPRFSAGNPQLLREGESYFEVDPSPANCDIAPDGQRFVMIKGDHEDLRCAPPFSHFDHHRL